MMASSSVVLVAYLLVSVNQMVLAQVPTAVAEFNSTSMSLSVPFDEVRMHCRIKSLPATDQWMSVHWSKMSEDGENVFPSDIQFTGHINQNLVINSFSPLQHTGNYFCKVTTRAGISYTSNRLQLWPKAPKIFPVQNPVEVLRNTRVELNCIVKSPPGNYSLRWHKGNRRIQTTEGYSPYVIENFVEDNEGAYACIVVSDGAGDDTTMFAVNIIEHPTFLTVPNTQTRDKGAVIQLSCMPTSNGNTSYIWKFKGETIAPSSRAQITSSSESSTLTVSGVTFNDEGSYTCEASNIAGTAVQTYRVEVEGSPEILSSGGLLEEVVLTTAVLDCQYVARPLADSVEWTRDGIEITSGVVLANKSLMLSNMTEETSGDYSCRVTSSRGSDSISYQLTVIGFPLMPTHLRHNMSSQDSRSVELSWNLPPTDQGKRLDGFKLEVWTNQKNQKHSQMFEISPNVSRKMLNDLFPGERYHAHLHSYNRAGTSAAVTTIFSLPVTAPKLKLNIVALEGGRSLAVQWELVYDGGPDVQLFTFDVYMIRAVSEMVHSVSPSLDAQEHIITGLQPTTRYMVCVTIANGAKQASLNQSVTTFAAPPSQPSLSITMVTTNRIHLSFSLLEGSSAISHFLLNTTVNDGPEKVQNVIARDDQEQVSATSEGNKLHVKLVILDLQPFTRYSFEVAAVSNIGTGEYSLPTDNTQLKDGRIVYFIVVGVVGGVFIVVGVVVATIAIMVKKSKAAQKRKRTFSINAGNEHISTSFASQSPPFGKSNRGGTPSSRGLQSPTSSSMRDIPAVMIMDVNHLSPAGHSNKTSSYEKLNRMRADSLASDSYSCSVGVTDHRLSVCQSEPGIAHHRRSPVSEFTHSQMHSSTGRMVTSAINPTHFRHKLPLTETNSYEQYSQGYLSPTEEDRRNLFDRSPSSADKHVPLLHQNSVEQRTTQLLSLPPGSISNSAPMINMRLSRESMMECLHSECMTDV